jgi:serine/threonine protein phosphatase 1
MLYAVGDIHGERGRLEKLLASLPLLSGDRFVFMGDYVDRGPDSRGVVELLIEHAKRWESVFLCGNHESMFLDFLGWKGAAYFGGDAFLVNGGDRTLASYGWFGERRGKGKGLDLPPAHVEFYRGLRLFHQEGDYLFVHAGLGPRGLQSGDLAYALRMSRPEDLLWNRTTHDLPHNLGITVVYGHTPNRDFAVRWNEPFSIGIDTGATYGGPLTAIRLPDETILQGV